jgi:hypothetical protein
MALMAICHALGLALTEPYSEERRGCVLRSTLYHHTSIKCWAISENKLIDMASAVMRDILEATTITCDFLGSHFFEDWALLMGLGRQLNASVTFCRRTLRWYSIS